MPTATLAAWILLLWACWQGVNGRAAAQSLIPGVDEWAEATTKSPGRKWVGPRVPFPIPTPRPQGAGRLDSAQAPLSVHWAAGVSEKRARRVLAAAEQAYALLETTGWVEHFGDAWQGGTPGHDFYVLADAARGADSAIDATEPQWGLDGARAFALLDARVPADHVLVCTTEALASALLYELDPAEAPSVRMSSAAYLAWLVTGQRGCDGDERESAPHPERAAFAREPEPSGTNWLIALGRRQNLNTGVFLRNMWQFARQYTWEGTGLRASPDLLEAIAKSFELSEEDFEDVAAELSDQRALDGLAPHHEPHVPWKELSWSALPQRVGPADPPLEPLGSSYALIKLEAPPKPMDRIRVWLRGEYGARWALSVVRVNGSGGSLGRMNAPARKNPNSYLTLDLTPDTAAVLVSVTNLADGTPDADDGAPFEVRSAALTLDHGD